MGPRTRLSERDPGPETHLRSVTWVNLNAY